MLEIFVEPWMPPSKPDLARLAMEVADQLGVKELRAWPEFSRGGIVFGGLPPFVSWHGWDGTKHHLVLVQAREVGGLVSGARPQPLPPGWFEKLDFESLARPLAHHPAFENGASIHLVHLPQRGDAQVRSWGRKAPSILEAVLQRISDVQVWNFSD